MAPSPGHLWSSLAPGGSGSGPDGPVTRAVVLKALERLHRDVLALQQRIAVRRAGAPPEATPDMSDSFLKLTASEEMCKEVMEIYQRLGESPERILQKKKGEEMIQMRKR